MTDLMAAVVSIFEQLAAAFGGKDKVPTDVLGRALAIQVNNGKFPTWTDADITSTATVVALSAISAEDPQNWGTFYDTNDKLIRSFRLAIVKPAVGDTTTAQFGNMSDNSGYREFVPVSVLAICSGQYLIHDRAAEMIGIASLTVGINIKGRLYCTKTRSCGEGSTGRQLDGYNTAQEAALWSRLQNLIN